jgi:tetratricopeptide (TPR) repeat protein
MKYRASFVSSLLERVMIALMLASGASFVVTTVAPASAIAKEKKKKKKKKDKGSAKKGDHGGEDEEGEESASEKPAKGKDAKGKEAKDKDAKPEEDAAPDPTKRQGAASFKVETAIDKKEFDRSKQADAKRDEAIEELKKLIPKAPAGRKAEMIFRLAELYWQKSKYNYALEMQAFEKAYQNWSDSGSKKNEPAAKDFTRESELIKQNALKLYEKVLTEYPTYERNDEVLFYLGYNEYEADNKDKAVGHYWTLIKQFPNSKLVPDAYLQLGEHFFNSNQVDKARKAYERALATPVPRVKSYALYKLSWCDYNVQEYAEGIKKLKQVIAESEKGKAGEGDPRLKNEALGDLARFFAYVDEVDPAFAYFKEKGGEKIAIQYTARLAELFHEQGKWDLEINTYRLLNNKYPMHEKAPTLQSRIVTAYSKLNNKEMVRKEVERLVDLYRPGTPWYKEMEKKGDKAALEYAYDLTESNLRELVTEYHADAQKRKDVPTYQLARDIYKKYLDVFTETDSAYQMRFYYGEVLWSLKEWKNAATIYDAVARMKPPAEAKSNYTRNAAFNSILAWEKIATEGEKGVLDVKEKISDKAKKEAKIDKTITSVKVAELDADKEYKREEIPENELRLSQACDFYFGIADAKDEDLPAIKFKAAWIYYKHNQFVEAAQRYAEIIERWPGTDLSHKAANLVLDSLNVQKQWEELEKYARTFRDNKKLVAGDKKFQDELQGLVEGASFKSILVADERARKLDGEEQKGALAKVATRFRGFQKEFPESQYSDKAVYNSLVIYNKADELDNAIEAAELLLDKYKKSDLIEPSHYMLADFQQKVSNFQQSADLFSKYYDTYKDPKDIKDSAKKGEVMKKAADALYNAGLYYQGIGDFKQAIAHYEKYTKDYADRTDAADVFWRICEIHEGEKNWKVAIECYTKVKDSKEPALKKVSQARAFEARYKIALAYEELKQHPMAVGVYKELVQLYPKLGKADQEAPGARLAAAHSAFELLEPEFKAYEGMKITLNKKTLEAKVKAAEELACVDSGETKCKKQGKFLGILQYGNGEYGIAALTRMGHVYRNLAQAIRNAPLPRNLDEDQLEIYRSELDNFALGPDEKALEAFENALTKAYELNVYNKWTLAAQDGIKELNPNKYPDLQQTSPRGAETFIVSSIRAKGAAPAAAPAEEDKGQEEEGEEGEEEEAEPEKKEPAKKAARAAAR